MVRNVAKKDGPFPEDSCLFTMGLFCFEEIMSGDGAFHE